MEVNILLDEQKIPELSNYGMSIITEEIENPEAKGSWYVVSFTFQPDVEYGYKAHTASGTAFNFFTALGDVAFAFAGHNVVLEIQATLLSSPDMPIKKLMWRGVLIAY